MYACRTDTSFGMRMPISPGCRAWRVGVHGCRPVSRGRLLLSRLACSRRGERRPVSGSGERRLVFKPAAGRQLGDVVFLGEQFFQGGFEQPMSANEEPPSLARLLRPRLPGMNPGKEALLERTRLAREPGGSRCERSRPDS